MRKLYKFVLVTFLCFPSGVLARNENVASDELYWVVSRIASSPERRGCVNMSPFAVGYQCGPNKAGFTYRRGDLLIDTVQFESGGSTAVTWMQFSEKNCIGAGEFENRLLNPGGRHSAKIRKSYDVQLSEGKGSRRVDELRFARAKVVVTYESSAMACVDEVSVEKRIPL